MDLKIVLDRPIAISFDHWLIHNIRVEFERPEEEHAGFVEIWAERYVTDENGKASKTGLAKQIIFSGEDYYEFVNGLGCMDVVNFILDRGILDE